MKSRRSYSNQSYRRDQLQSRSHDFQGGSNGSNKYEQVAEYTLDLHGYTTAECKVILDELLVSRKYSHVHVIVGKGLNSENGPVLPYFVKNYLNERNIRFNQAKIQQGGEGALEVYF